ncbi:DUF6174 domain-containing protein [Streptomyces sp. B6B3]|uniref:DUF6174 domain-containing protein n=1 Tax=Streptomyces sp. B6B3 TaxID=3153570 RepID=UPI00325E7E44
MRITITRIAACLLPLSLAATLVACGEADAGSESGAEWREPRDYAYTLTQTCGEQTVTGTFRVTVEDGHAVGWEPVGENHTPESADVPSIGGLLAQAEQAREDGADTVEIEHTDAGRPTLIDIDYDTNAIDDETCYEISQVTP